MVCVCFVHVRAGVCTCVLDFLMYIRVGVVCDLLCDVVWRVCDVLFVFVCLWVVEGVVCAFHL